MASSLLYTLDPTEANPQPRSVTDFGSNTTTLTGIAPLDDNLYAISGGLHTSYAFERGSMNLYIVSLEKGTIVDRIPVPDTATMNGLAFVPHNPHRLLSADSIDGRIFSINTRTREVSVAFDDALLGPSNGNGSSGLLPIAINGLRTRGDFIYFTNSNQGTFIYDDFTFDLDGNAYVAVHSSSVVKIIPQGVQTTIAGGEGDPLFKEPTSIALANDEKSIYVVAGGNFRSNPREGGQVIQIQL